MALISFPSKVLFLLSEKGDTLRKGALSLKQTLNSTKKKMKGKVGIFKSHIIAKHKNTVIQIVSYGPSEWA